MNGWQDNFWWSSNIAEWIGGVGTALGLGFAGWQVRRENERAERDRADAAADRRLAVESLELQAERDARELALRDREQAALVSCMTVHFRDSEPHREGVFFRVMNHSPVHIYDVKLFIKIEQTVTFTAVGGIGIAPGEGEVHDWEMPRNVAVEPGQHCGATFRDNAGRRWVKWGDGRLLPGGRDLVMMLSPSDRPMLDHDPRDAVDPFTGGPRRTRAQREGGPQTS